MVSMAMLSDRRLTGRQFKVLCVLRMFADSKTGIAHPKRWQIAEITGLSENKITDATRALEGFGWVSREGDGGRSTSTIYTLFDEPKTHPKKGCINPPQNGVGLTEETHPVLVLNPPRFDVKPTPKRGGASNRP